MMKNVMVKENENQPERSSKSTLQSVNDVKPIIIERPHSSVLNFTDEEVDFDVWELSTLVNDDMANEKTIEECTAIHMSVPNEDVSSLLKSS